MTNPETHVIEGIFMLVPWAVPAFMVAIGVMELAPITGIFALGADIYMLALFKE